MLVDGPDDPFMPAQFAGLLASAAGMVLGSLAPQLVRPVHDLSHPGQHERHGQLV